MLPTLSTSSIVIPARAKTTRIKRRKLSYRSTKAQTDAERSDLSWFYTEPNFFGYEYQAFGDYGACYNLPEAFDKQAQSFASQLPTKPDLICCLYTTWYCDEAGHDSAIVDAEHGAQDGAIKQLLGYFKNGVSSYRCALWKDGQSNCFGTGPGQKPT